MSETATEQAATETVSGSVDEVSTDNSAPKTFDEDYVKSLRQEAAKYRTQFKEASEKAKAYDEYLESQKSEQQKMADALEAASRERDDLKSQMMRLKVAREKQLPDSLVDRLRGETEEDMLADADALMSGLQALTVKPKPSVEQVGTGVVGEADAPMDPATLAAAVLRR